MTDTRAFKFAVLAIVGLAAAIIGLSIYYTMILSSRDFCATVVGSKVAAGSISQGVVTACASLMSLQLQAIATNSYVNSITIAIVIVALTVLVIAGGRISFHAGKDGVGGDLSRDPGAAADAVAGAAVSKAADINGAQS